MLVLFSLSLTGAVHALTDEESFSLQSSLKDKTTGEKIALIAERFVGTPYDTNPIGEYVARKAIVCDDRVDCMYLAFRTVELALSSTPEGAVHVALDKRFREKGILENGKVVNYGNRFEYGEDMIGSGKWGRDITREVGRTAKMRDLRNKRFIDFLPSAELLRGTGKLESGDILFLIKDSARKKRGEVVGHIGIIKREKVPNNDEIYLIHASGHKGKGGVVKKTRLKDYIRKMPFIGAMISRFP